MVPPKSSMWRQGPPGYVKVDVAKGAVGASRRSGRSAPDRRFRDDSATRSSRSLVEPFWRGKRPQCAEWLRVPARRREILEVQLVTACAELLKGPDQFAGPGAAGHVRCGSTAIPIGRLP